MGVVTTQGEEVNDDEIVVRTIKDEPLKGVVSYERKLTIEGRPYQSESAFHSVQYDIDREDEAEQIVTKAREAFYGAKAVVYESLGLPMEVNDQGVLMEVVRRAFPGTEVVREDSEPTAATVGAEPPHDPDTIPKGKEGVGKRRENGEWAVARFQSHPSEFYDNRHDKPTDKHPDIKHKATGVGGWMD